MLKIEKNNIALNQKAVSKKEAIRLAGLQLVSGGFIDQKYIDSMQAREKIANTYIGKGIAIPHGLPENRDLILKTGLSFIQLPDGVTWNSNETVKLVVAIAAQSDEHIQILSRLTHLLDDQSAIEKLTSTENKEEFITILQGQKPIPKTTAMLFQPGPDSIDIECAIPGPIGLHARPATLLVNHAKQFSSQIMVQYDQKFANAKSLASLLKLGARGKNKLKIFARGKDARAALACLKEQIEKGLGENQNQSKVPAPRPQHQSWAPQSVENTIKGIPASRGIAIGQIKILKKVKFVYDHTAKDPAVEKEKLDHAISIAKSELNNLYTDMKQRAGENKAAIFKAHLEFLDDPDLIETAVNYMNQNKSAAWSWHETFTRNAQNLIQLDNPVLAQRATDIKDVGNRVLKILAKKIVEQGEQPDQPYILIAEDLTPSDTAALDPQLVLGFCTVEGAATSHTAITARSLNIPAVVGCGPSLMWINDQIPAIIDGNNGFLYANPSPSDLSAAQKLKKSIRDFKKIQFQDRYQPAITRDNHGLAITANISSVQDADKAIYNGAEGIGLLRSEFLFLNRESPPGEEEQYAAYSKILESSGGLPLIIRTLDIGGDKQAPYLGMARQDNSFLGMRGIRLCFQKQDIFQTQLRAILRASQNGPLKIMYPMIATLEELKKAQTITETLRQEINGPQVETGMMVEIPSAVMMAGEFAEEVDFFSIGTNDLTQYTLAMDRLNPNLAPKADGLHPSVLRMIEKTVAAGLRADIPCKVCGGIAGEPLGAILLMGLGIKELSISIPNIPAIKALLRKINYQDALELAQKALSAPTAEAVRALNYT